MQIIVYFSRAGNNYVSGTVKNLTVGNTEKVAKMLQAKTEADLFKIEPMVSYSGDYSQCIEEARQDFKREARPELKAYPALEPYNTIYLGYPNYWGTMPMAVFTFLEKYDFTGKTIQPFCTHEGSGMGDSEGDIRRVCPEAQLAEGLAIHGSKLCDADAAIAKWLQK